MATVHHLSNVTNSCFKPPINPKTGLAFTINERDDGGRSNILFDNPDINGVDNENVTITNGSVNFDTAHYDTLVNQDMTDLPDDLFYQKLLRLKEEHKKTLELCERMYTEQLETQRRVRSRSPSPVSRTQPSTGRSIRSPSPMHRTPPMSPSHSEPPASMTKSRSIDMVRDMSGTGKPPLPKKSFGSPQVRPSSATGRYTSQESNSSFEAEFRASANNVMDRQDDWHNDTRSSAMSKIEDMWENFSVEEYTPRRSMRKRSNSLTRLSDPTFKSKSLDLEKWQHRITIPKPFTMTLRDEAKTPKKTKAMIELEEKRLEEERLQEEECQKKFKAKPVPAHIYIPLYDEIMEEQETRRRTNKQKSTERTQTLQKPFKLSTREQEKKEKVRRYTQLEEQDNSSKKSFKAKPYPAHLFGHTVNDKLQEEEAYRQIRMHMRSQDLLKSSSLPPNMASRGKDYIDGRSRQKIHAERAKKAGITVEHKFKPRINDDIPDFDDMHRKFLRELGQKKAEREATICKPFNLRTAHIPSTKHKIYDDIARDEIELKENRWPFQSGRATVRSAKNNYFTGKKGMNGALSTSLDSIPAKMTTSAHLRTSANKAKMQAQMEAELIALENERKKRLKMRQLQQEIRDRAVANDQTVDLALAKMEKIRQQRLAEKAQKEEYRKYLNEIQERVDRRPLLFEQTAQENARKAAEKKYAAVLHNAGLDESMIESQGSARSRPMSRATYSRSPSRSLSRSPTRSGSRSPMSHSRSMTAKYSEDFEDHTHASDPEEDFIDA